MDSVSLNSGFRPDTTRVSLIIKTPVNDTDDNIEKVYERIETFIDNVPETGRALISDDSDPGMSLVNMQQYRLPI